MYDRYFGFSTKPFENNFDQRFLFLGANHREILASLLYFVKEKKALAFVCGDVGTGKSMLINSFLERLPQYVQTINISNPDVHYLAILKYIARQLRLETSEKTVLELLEDVKNELIERNARGQQFVLIIDEAHLLSDRSLEHIRLLSNIETSSQKLLQILLVGQYELSPKLDRPEMRQLRQRISINRFLSPLDRVETIEYIDHRLRVVGSSFKHCFEPNCKNLIYKKTNGVPRRINHICDNALLICKTKEKRKINARIVYEADQALQSDIIFTPKMSDKRKLFRLKPSLKRLAFLGNYLFILILLAVLANQGLLGGNLQSSIQSISAKAGKLYSHWSGSNRERQAVTEKIPNILRKREDGPPGEGPAPNLETTSAVPNTRHSGSSLGNEASGEMGGVSPSSEAGGSGMERSKAPAGQAPRPFTPTAAPPIITRSTSTGGSGESNSAAVLPLVSWVNGSGGDATAEKPLSSDAVSDSDIKTAAVRGPRFARTPANPDDNAHSPARSVEVLNDPQGVGVSKQDEEPSSLISNQSGMVRNRGSQETGADAAPSINRAAGESISQKEAGRAGDSSANLPAVRKVVVKRGDTLMQIAAQYYPEDPDKGLEILLLNNPDITNKNRIYPDQVLLAPELKYTDNKIEVRDDAFYLPYDQHGSLGELQDVMDGLIERDVKYFVENTLGVSGNLSHRILIGGYDKKSDLKHAMMRLGIIRR